MATLRTIRDVRNAEPVKHRAYPGPNKQELNEARRKYKEEYEQSGSFDVTVPYGMNYGRTHLVTDVTQPYCQTVSQFAVEEHNKDLSIEKQLCLANIVRINYESAGLGVLLYLTLKVKDRSGYENTCRAKVFTCNADCKKLREFALAPFRRSCVYRIGWATHVMVVDEPLGTMKIRSKEELQKMSDKEKLKYHKRLKWHEFVNARLQKKIKIENVEQQEEAERLKEEAKPQEEEEAKPQQEEANSQHEEGGYMKVYEFGEPCMHLKNR